MEETRGERHLLAAILLRAIKDVLAFSRSLDRGDQAIAAEAQSWLFEEAEDENEDEHHLTSFPSICKLMDLDKEKVRTQVQSLRFDSCPDLGQRQVRGVG